MASDMIRMNDGATSVVHIVVERMFPIDRGHGNVDHEFGEGTLCDLFVTDRWFEQDAATPVTCITCFVEHSRLARFAGTFIGVKTGRMSCSST